MKLIAMAGLAQTGKSTAADYLHSVGFTQLAFADPIKAMVAYFLDEELDWIEDNKTLVPPQMEEIAPNANITVRKLLQTLGTEWGRHQLHSDIWLNCLLRDLPWYREWALPGVVITDLRFDNEAKAIRKEGGVIVHILRSDAPKLDKHPSEMMAIAPDPSDYFIRNNGTIQDLHIKLDKMLNLYDKLIKMRR